MGEHLRLLHPDRSRNHFPVSIEGFRRRLDPRLPGVERDVHRQDGGGDPAPRGESMNVQQYAV